MKETPTIFLYCDWVYVLFCTAIKIAAIEKSASSGISDTVIYILNFSSPPHFLSLAKRLSTLHVCLSLQSRWVDANIRCIKCGWAHRLNVNLGPIRWQFPKWNVSRDFYLTCIACTIKFIEKRLKIEIDAFLARLNNARVETVGTWKTLAIIKSHAWQRRHHSPIMTEIT